ncbi:permease prefix domain 1-containing protein [Streptomyces oceani]|uniref:Uncharacterized protein n=1 Tax=Streptomyces oceani TaxID=1075402 RepID=A0A1E7KGE5_9ACTN|nr:permease prefix domain 1-containing protein [Streptomyces oceani]OEV02999.1 hypothetical protein AN216_13595 [Streptomyces oceani]
MSDVDRTSRAADPVETHAADLAARLRGPARAKARMVREIRDGLYDTVAAHTERGTRPELAAQRAVREFGTPEELAPSCQQELTIIQARRTARVLALTVPLPLGMWWLSGGTGSDVGGNQLPRTVELFAALPAGVWLAAVLLAVATYLATGPLSRWLPTPHRLPTVIAWTGSIAATAMGTLTLLLVLASPWSASWPQVAVAGALVAVPHGLVAASARACRRCVTA